MTYKIINKGYYMKRIISFICIIATMLNILMLIPFNNKLLADDIYLTADPEGLGLPVMYINTDNGERISTREFYVSGSLKLEEDYNGPINIKARGNSSWWEFKTKKRAYTVKLDKKTDLLGLGKAKKWTLIANFSERSQMRNKFIYDLSGRLGMAYSKSEYVNLVLNGEYMGIYMLCRKIDPKMCDIEDYEEIAEDAAKIIKENYHLSDKKYEELEDAMEKDLSWLSNGIFQNKYKISLSSLDIPDTGNYLLELDEYYDEYSKFRSDMGVAVMVRAPEYLKTNSERWKELKSFINDFEEALSSSTFVNSKGKHYSEYIDVDSFVDYFLLNALMLNVEFGYKSQYCYITSAGKIVMGPCWDYDWSSGNHFFPSTNNYKAWYPDWRCVHNKWYHKLYGDPSFVNKARERWFEIQDIIKEEIENLESIYVNLMDSAELEINCYNADPYETDYRYRSNGWTFQEEYEYFASFLLKRASWMTTQLEKRDPNIDENGVKYGFKSKASVKLDISSDTIDILSGTKYDKSVIQADYYVNTCSKNDVIKIAVTLPYNATKAIAYIDGTVSGVSNDDLADTVYINLSASHLKAGMNTIIINVLDESNSYKGANYFTVRLANSPTNSNNEGNITDSNSDIIPIIDNSDNNKSISKLSKKIIISIISIVSVIIVLAALIIIFIAKKKKAKKP